MKPHFWWDFEYTEDPPTIIVEGYRFQVRGKYSVLAKFPLPTTDATEQIRQAETLIADYKAGRKTPPWKDDT